MSRKCIVFFCNICNLFKVRAPLGSFLLFVVIFCWSVCFFIEFDIYVFDIYVYIGLTIWFCGILNEYLCTFYAVSVKPTQLLAIFCFNQAPVIIDLIYWKTTQNPPKKRWKNSLQKIKNITSNDFNFNKSAVIRWINSLVHARDFVSRSENSN